MSDKAQIEANALFTLLNVAMGKTAFTSMLTRDARVGLAADLAGSILEYMGISPDGTWVDKPE